MEGSRDRHGGLLVGRTAKCIRCSAAEGTTSLGSSGRRYAPRSWIEHTPAALHPGESVHSTAVRVLDGRFNLGLRGTKQGLRSRWAASPGSEPAVTSKRRLTFVRTIDGGFIIRRGFCVLACCVPGSVLGCARVKGENRPRDPTWAGLLLNPFGSPRFGFLGKICLLPLPRVVRLVFHLQNYFVPPTCIQVLQCVLN